MRPKAIHQIHEGSAYGDGITNGMFFLQKILRDAGFKSEIFCANVAYCLSGRIKILSEFDDRADDLVFVHYSLGSPHDYLFDNLNCAKVLIYHNITPHTFFPLDSNLYRLSQAGRSQLRHWGSESVSKFIGCIADSDFNAEELRRAGFCSITSIGLLVDLDSIRRHKWNAELHRRFSMSKNILFVGNFIEHKGQLDLIRMYYLVKQAAKLPVNLILVGGTASEGYRTRVEAEISRLGLSESVHVLGKCNNEDLYAIYRAADLYASLSEHEGFGMPLVEAMAFDVPVLAASAGSIAATLNGGGVVLDDRDSTGMAAAAKLVLEEPSLRTTIITRQRAAVARYERPILTWDLEVYLKSLGFEVHLTTAPTMSAQRSARWRIEGPFDSSYSLAIVNRELARSLARAGESVEIVSRDGPGPFAPNVKFLMSDPEMYDMCTAAEQNSGAPDVTLRNQYPPKAVDMRGVLRAAANYAWEESGFPLHYVHEFNATLNLITVTSRFVAKVLRDNGVHVPIRVVGNGVDQIVESSVSPLARAADGVFRFLHVSSCFPRKGVDVLLSAWAKAFRSVDNVELTIKTFPNPHNDIAKKLKCSRDLNNDIAPIQLIDDDIGIDAMRNLFHVADAVVCPSRGEGFGLVLAEALALGRPVIATAFGGHTDFCSPETAWLCDYSFASSRSHFEIPGSVWVEPDPDSLAHALIACRSAPEEERRRRAEAGRRLISNAFTWSRVAARTKEAVQMVSELSLEALRLPRVGWVTTWNSRCGIAAYARSLACEIEPGRLAVFANHTSDRVKEDEPFVRRCWIQGWEDPLDELYTEIVQSAVKCVVVQFNYGFFRLAALERLIERLDESRIVCFVVLHSTTDVLQPDMTIRLADARGGLARCRRLLVHSVHDLNRLKAIGLVENVSLFPQGMAGSFSGDRDRQRRILGLSDRTVIASFGFLLPHKGLPELLQAFALLRKNLPNAHLMMLNALYPASESDAEHQLLREMIAQLGVSKEVTLATGFLDEADVVSRLAAADVIVYPYQQTRESSSAAIKLGLASLSPVACTPLPIFDDGFDVVHRLPGFMPREIAEDLARFLSDRSDLAIRRERQRVWVDRHAWPDLSDRLNSLIRGEVLEAAMPEAWRQFS